MAGSDRNLALVLTGLTRVWSSSVDLFPVFRSIGPSPRGVIS